MFNSILISYLKLSVAMQDGSCSIQSILVNIPDSEKKKVKLFGKLFIVEVLKLYNTLFSEQFQSYPSQE